MGFGSEVHRAEVTFSSHHIKGICQEHAKKLISDGIDLSYLANIVSARFLHFKVTLPTSLSKLHSLEASHLAYPTVKATERSSTFRGK